MPIWALAMQKQARTYHDAGRLVGDQGMYKYQLDGGLPDEAPTCRRLCNASRCAAAVFLKVKTTHTVHQTRHLSTKNEAPSPVGGRRRVAIAQLQRGKGEVEGLDGDEHAQVRLGHCPCGRAPEQRHGVPVEQRHLAPQQQRLHDNVRSGFTALNPAPCTVKWQGTTSGRVMVYQNSTIRVHSRSMCTGGIGQ